MLIFKANLLAIGLINQVSLPQNTQIHIQKIRHIAVVRVGKFVFFGGDNQFNNPILQVYWQKTAQFGEKYAALWRSLLIAGLPWV